MAKIVPSAITITRTTKTSLAADEGLTCAMIPEKRAPIPRPASGAMLVSKPPSFFRLAGASSTTAALSGGV
jgi:hypothetical protein